MTKSQISCFASSLSSLRQASASASRSRNHLVLENWSSGIASPYGRPPGRSRQASPDPRRGREAPLALVCQRQTTAIDGSGQDRRDHGIFGAALTTLSAMLRRSEGDSNSRSRRLSERSFFTRGEPAGSDKAPLDGSGQDRRITVNCLTQSGSVS